jgi:hypothetical protein
MSRPCFTGLPWVLSTVIDRQRVFVSIVRAICNVWRKINGTTFLTDEQNELSLCPPEGPRNLSVSNSLCFCTAHTSSHVSSELYAFRCLLGHYNMYEVGGNVVYYERLKTNVKESTRFL